MYTGAIGAAFFFEKIDPKSSNPSPNCTGMFRVISRSISALIPVPVHNKVYHTPDDYCCKMASTSPTPNDDNDDAKYLHVELQNRMQTEPELFDWIQSATLDGLWYVVWSYITTTWQQNIHRCC
jgi:hypothetical protein